jgi:peptide deformylase
MKLTALGCRGPCEVVLKLVANPRRLEGSLTARGHLKRFCDHTCDHQDTVYFFDSLPIHFFLLWKSRRVTSVIYEYGLI